MQRLVIFLFLFVITSTFSVRETHNHSHHQKPTSLVLAFESDCSEAGHEHPQSDCSCPLSRSQCCHNPVFVNKNSRPEFIIDLSQNDFTEVSYLSKPSPDLEGPFQPPRV